MIITFEDQTFKVTEQEHDIILPAMAMIFNNLPMEKTIYNGEVADKVFNM